MMYNFDGTEQIFDAATQSKFFFEYTFGSSYTGRTSLGFRNTRGFDATASLGWWFSSAFAARSGFHVTNADWASSSYAGHSTKLLVGTRGATFDLLINPFVLRITSIGINVSVLISSEVTNSVMPSAQIPCLSTLTKVIILVSVPVLSCGPAFPTVSASRLSLCSLP